MLLLRKYADNMQQEEVYYLYSTYFNQIKSNKWPAKKDSYFCIIIKCKYKKCTSFTL